MRKRSSDIFLGLNPLLAGFFYYLTEEAKSWLIGIRGLNPLLAGFFYYPSFVTPEISKGYKGFSANLINKTFNLLYTIIHYIENAGNFSLLKARQPPLKSAVLCHLQGLAVLYSFQRTSNCLYSPIPSVFTP